MQRIKLLNLFRCSSAERRVTEKEIHYFVTDYFDGIKVEDLDLTKVTLAECLGIQRAANAKIGVSHQRYCLLDPYDAVDDILVTDHNFPLLTIIQVFINPDIYQAEAFDEGGEISCDNCMEMVRDCIKNRIPQKKDVHWKLYRLLTEGDFAIIVRSKKIHDAYDISTVVRNICVRVQDKNVGYAFFTYSISGIIKKKLAGEIDWIQCLNQNDRVAVRICYSHKLANEYDDSDSLQMKKKFLSLGKRLLGRYDYQMECTPEEFQMIYPYIRDFKFEEDVCIPDSISDDTEKLKVLLWMMRKGYILRINEKILLDYGEDIFLTGKNNDVWGLNCKGQWKSLYDRNHEMICRVKGLAVKTEKLLEPLYQSARNLKEYTRLIGRLCRILHEINQLRELRVSVANLLNQVEIMLGSLETYIENAKNSGYTPKEYANGVEEYLHIGIDALENFTRYIRNINLQTLQTPNYDLQTNVCVEKMFLAYSQFLRFFMDKEKEKSFPYFLNDTFYPIVIPDMSVIDLSVSVLFDECFPSIENRVDGKKLMVVFSPTFSYLCETCFLIPTAFHELAHYFRYEERKIRNRNVAKYVLKLFLMSIVSEILDDDGEYLTSSEPFVEKIIKDVYDHIENRVFLEENEKCGLRNLEGRLEDIVGRLCSATKHRDESPVSIVRYYVDKTKKCVRCYDLKIIHLLTDLSPILQKDQVLLQDSEKSKLYDIFTEYKEEQERQIIDEIRSLFKKIETDDRLLQEQIKKFQDGDWDGDDAGKMAFGIWDKCRECIGAVDKEKLKNLLKYLRMINGFYSECERKWQNDYSKTDLSYKELFDDICQDLYESLLKNLTSFQQEQDEIPAWETMLLEESRVEYLRKMIKIEKKGGIERRLKDILCHYTKVDIHEFVHGKIDIYREVTSDLFMCSIMRLESFGYLVIVAENFVFVRSNKNTLYQRVSAVLQCLCKKRYGDILGSEEFDKDLMDIFLAETGKLVQEYNKAYEQDQRIENADIDHIIAVLDTMRNNRDLTSTQDWILRIHLQIAHIIYNIMGTRSISEGIGEKDIWRDMVSDNSYIQNKDKLNALLEENDGKELCENISKILNSPATYFVEKKSLSSEEIQFILCQYEKNCKRIMQQNMPGRM